MSSSDAITLRVRHCERFDAEWACALFPTPEIYKPRSKGGVGVLTGNSAALYRLVRMDDDGLDELIDRFNRWLDEKLIEKQSMPLNMSYRDARRLLAGRRKLQVYGYVYREVDRYVGEADVNALLGAAALWAYARLPRDEQLALADEADARFEQQQRIDAEAIVALHKIMNPPRGIGR